MKKPVRISTLCSSNGMCDSGSLSNTPKDEYVDIIKETFEENFNFRYVCLNFEYDTFYKTWIYEGNEKDKTLGFKYLQSYPYKKIKFKQGDFVHFDYKHVNQNTKSKKNAERWTTWIMQSFDCQETFDAKGRMLFCNNILNFYSSDKSKQSVPCSIQDSMKYTTWDYGTKGVIIEGADIVAISQNNDKTKFIDVNTRLIFNQNAYKVVQKNVIVDSNLLELYLTKCPELPNDDLVNNFPAMPNFDNLKEVEDSVNGDIVDPIDTSIYLGDAIEYKIYNYKNGVKELDTFTVEASGVPSSNYEIITTDGNNFVIENKKRYAKNSLKIKLTNNVSGNITEFDVWLLGV